MAWSTREIAELAGTSLRAVRHYHEIGLLEEPERRSNGYKHYGVEHLVRLVRIKRMTGLGFSLTQIASMTESHEYPDHALDMLDAELSATIESLQKARVELAVIRHHDISPDIPPSFAPIAHADELNDADRSLIVVLSQVLGPAALDTLIRYGEWLRTQQPTTAMAELYDLPADADEQTCHDLASRLRPQMEQTRVEFPELWDLLVDAPRGTQFGQLTIETAMRDLYNPAQISVLHESTAGLA